MNTTVWIIIGVILMFLLFSRMNEPFSSSGLAISDADCAKLANVYYRPDVNDPKCRAGYNQEICGKTRRSTITDRTGNYYTMNGQLV